MWREPEIEGLIAFKTTEDWDQFVVPRPATEAGGRRRETCMFVNEWFLLICLVIILVWI
jgi:hypothetical protein